MKNFIMGCLILSSLACNVFLYQEYDKSSLLVSSVNLKIEGTEKEEMIQVCDVNKQVLDSAELVLSSVAKPVPSSISLASVEPKIIEVNDDHLDYSAVDDTVSTLLFSEDQMERERAVKGLAELSSDNMKVTLYKMINNPDEDLGVRITSIESLNWKNNAQALLDVYDFNLQTLEIKLSVIYTAKDIPFNEEDKLIIEEKFLNAFQEENDTSVRIAFADYFSHHNPDRLSELADILSEQDDVPMELSEYFQSYELS